MTTDPTVKRMKARAAAYASWADCDDWTERTKPARLAFRARFENQVDPDRKLPPAIRAKRADAARKAYMLAISAKGVEARATKRKAGK